MTKTIAALLGTALLALTLSTRVSAADANSLEGTWKAEVKSSWGDTQIRSIELKDGHFTYEVKTADGALRLFAKGDFKLLEYGPFKAVRFTNIQGGESRNDLISVDDREMIYLKDYRTLYLASNFDQNRYDETVEAVGYKKQTQ